MSRFRQATRAQAKLRAALIGPAGSGKTFSALALATAMAEEMRRAGRGEGKIGLIDTEVGSSELYAKRFGFLVMNLTDHSPLSFVEAIHDAEDEGIDFLVIDSLSHAWMGKGGALEQVDKAAERDPRGNSFTAWRSVTPKHNKLVDTILSCKPHLIACIRAKTEYVQEKNEKTGKTEIRKLGMAAIQRDGLEYEFTLVGDLDLSNSLKISKTRLDGVILPGDVFEKPGESLGKKIYAWLIDGAEVPAPSPAAPLLAERAAAPVASVADPVAPPTPAPAAPADDTAAIDPVLSELDRVFAGYLADLEEATDLGSLDKVAAGPAKPVPGTRQHELATKVYRARRKLLRGQAAAPSQAVAS